MKLAVLSKPCYQSITLIFVILFFAMSFFAEGSITLKSNNDSANIESLSNQSISLSLYEVASYYKADFQWNSINEQIKLSKDKASIRLTLGNPHILINERNLKLLSTPLSINQGVIAISPQDAVIILSELVPSMQFTYNEAEASIIAKGNNDDSKKIDSSNKIAFNDSSLGDGQRLPGNFNLKTIVIDAGHGGHDPGANRSGVKEKDIVLDISKRLAEILEAKTSLKVVMTRDKDVFIPLSQRTSIANKYPPENTLFLCLHINASPSKSGGRGTETYIFNLEATDAEARALAKRENEGEAMDLTVILSHCYHTGTELYSLEIANRVQKTITSQLGLDNRGVRRAPFYVLAGTKMPAILVELAYVSNPSEREKLNTPSFRQNAAEALYDAIIGFKSAIDRSLTKAKAN